MTRYRPMTIADYTAAAALWQHADGVRLRTADSHEHIARYLVRNAGLSFVAEIDGSVVGTLLAGHDGRRGYLQHLAVAPQCRRRGIGTALVRHCLAALAQQGIAKSHISILVDNAAGKAFWTALGWQRRTDIDTWSLTNASDPNS